MTHKNSEILSIELLHFTRRKSIILTKFNT